MKTIKTIWFKFLILIMIITSSACSSGGNSNSTSISPSISNEPTYSDIEISEEDTNLSSSQNDLKEDKESTIRVEPQRVRIDADGGLRMRKGPGTEYDVIQIISKYELVDLADGEESHTDWVYVYYDGDYGWISTEFIKYESDLPSMLEDGASSWAKVYSDFLMTYEAVTYTSTMYGSQHLIAGHVVNGEMKGSDLVEFWDINGYDYPVLTSREIPIDADGNTDSPMFAPTAYIINSNNDVVEIGESEWLAFFKNSNEGLGWDVKGNFIVGFVLKPENGGSPENVQEAIKWLRNK